MSDMVFYRRVCERCPNKPKEMSPWIERELFGRNAQRWHKKYQWTIHSGFVYTTEEDKVAVVHYKCGDKCDYKFEHFMQIGRINPTAK